MRLTVDPVEFRGYRYHTGLALTVFAPGRHEELGRGGRYFSADGEPATGITLYADAVLRAAPAPGEMPVIYIPAGTPADIVARQRAAGFATLVGLEAAGDVRAEAQRLGCSHWLDGQEAIPTPPSVQE